MKLFIIDGYGFVFRAYHSLPPLTTPEGTPVGAVYGFINMLLRFINNHDIDMLAIALDTGGKNFRHQIYPAYKANRPEAPEDLSIQFPIIGETIDAFSITKLVQQELEADDLIAACAKKAVDLGMKVTIVSSDKDLMQLVNDDIVMFDPIKNKFIDSNAVFEKFNVMPAQIADYLSLTGDSSDNVPGVKGIGAKSAAELLAQYKNLDCIYHNINNIKKPRQQKLLVEGKHNAYLSKKLVRLDNQDNIGIDFSNMQYNGYDGDKLQVFLQKYGFKRLIHITSKTMPVEQINFQQIQNIDAATIEQIYRNGYLCCYHDEKDFYISSGNINYKINYNNVQQGDFFEPDDSYLSIESILMQLKEIFESTQVNKIVLDAKKLFKQLYNININLRAFDDIQIMAYALDTGKYKYSWQNLCEIYLQQKVEQFNSHFIYLIYEQLQQNLLKQKSFSLYYRIDKKLIAILAAIEIKGMCLCTNILTQLEQEFNEKLYKIEQQIYKETNCQFNIGSPKQLGEVLFDKLSLPQVKKTKTKNYSTSSDVLTKLSFQGFTIAASIINWRHYSKLISTYTNSLAKAIDRSSGRIHTTFSMISTNTGRLSSNNPNLQNIPIRTKEGHKIRTAFIASVGNVIISADYSQIELKILAYMANIPSLKAAFELGHDIHNITAKEIFNVTEVTSELRHKAKAINFGIIYGISAFGLAQRLGITNYEAQIYIDKYFAKYPEIRSYIDKTIAMAQNKGYVVTLFGRRCYINDINHKNANIRNFAKRAAINAPLQGTNADIIKKAMICLPKKIQQYLVLQVHDELIFDLPREKTEEYSNIVKNTMESVYEIKLKVDIKYGINWANTQ